MEIYQKPMRSPTTLECGHTVCMVCGKSLIKFSKITCPFDKREFKVTILSPNYEMMSILEEASVSISQAFMEKEKMSKEQAELRQKIKNAEKMTEELRKEMNAKHSEELQQKIDEAQAILQAKAEKKLKKKLRIGEDRLRKNLEKEMKVKCDAIEKEKEKQIEQMRKKSEAKTMEQEREKKSFMESLLQKQEAEQKRLQEEQQKKELLMESENAEKERKIKQELDDEISKRRERLKIEEEIEWKKIQEAMEIEKKRLQEELEYEKMQLNQKMLEEYMEKKRELEEEAARKIQQENEEKAFQRAKMEEMQREVEERNAKFALKKGKKIRQGKLVVENSGPGKRSNESMHRDDQRIYWAFVQGNNTNYIEYYSNFSIGIEKAFRERKDSYYMEKRLAHIDFNRWCEVRDNGEILQIKRVNSMVGKSKWMYLGDRQWEEIDSVNYHTIEMEWLRKAPNCVLNTGAFCDFNTLKGKINGKERPLLREVIKN